MVVPHQHRRSPILLVLAALGTAGVAVLFPGRDEAPHALRTGAGSGADAEPLGDSAELRADLHAAGRTLEMLQKMRGAVALDGAGPLEPGR